MSESGQNEISPDLCVIGAGAGGLAAAAAAAAFGVNVVLIEKDRMGGESRSGGALPSKALLAAAAHAYALRNGGEFGTTFGTRAPGAGVDFDAVRAHVRDVIAAAEPQDSRARFTALGVRVIDGAARFSDRSTVAVNGHAVKARRFVIATGAAPALPPIAGLAETPYLTGATVFDLAECPRHLIIVGADAAGLELAQAFRRLGAEVTVLATQAPLIGLDAECATVVLDALTREGVVLRTGIAVTRVRRALARLQVDIASEAGEETIEGSHLLIAAGRRPNVLSLDLEAAGIRYDENGIVVDQRLRTSNRRVYAIGDVTDTNGVPKSAHLANHHAALVIRNALFRTAVNAERHAVPAVLFTDPELAQVGLTEEAARSQAGGIRVLRWPYRQNDRALASGLRQGHIKIVTDRNGAILGTSIVGKGAAENIAAWALAINQKLNIEALAGVIVPYPTYAEVGKRAAMTYFTRGLTSPLVRRIIGWLRRFG